MVLPQLLGGARVRRCHGLCHERALAFAMGTHVRLGAGADGARSKRWSRRVAGKTPAGGDEMCLYSTIPRELMRLIVEACEWRSKGGPVGMEGGVVRLMGGRTRTEDVRRSPPRVACIYTCIARYMLSLLALTACTHCLPATDPRPVHAAGCVSLKDAFCGRGHQDIFYLLNASPFRSWQLN